MKTKGFKKILLLGVAVTMSIIIAVLAYWPFVQMEDVDVEAYWGNHFDESMHDRIQVQLTRIQLYPLYWFIHKGDKYSNISMHDERNISQKMDITFNWDNSVTISQGEYKYDLYVDRIEILEKMFPYHEYVFEQHENEDSLFIGICMYDKKNNEIAVFRQKSMMPYEGRRVAFAVNINGAVLETGNKSRFDY